MTGRQGFSTLRGSGGDRRLLWVIVKFGLIFAAFDALIFFLAARTSAIRVLEDATARVAAWLIVASGVSATRVAAPTLAVPNPSIILPNRVLAISADCTGVFLAAMLVALILAYPIRPSLRAVGMVGGVAVLLVVNLARLVAVAGLSVAAPSLFQVAHDFLFQVGMVMVVLGVWAAWLAYARRLAL